MYMPSWLSERCCCPVHVMSGDPCIKCSCDMVGWCGDLAKVASPRSPPELCLGRVDGASVA
jgi:hypothetical protein